MVVAMSDQELRPERLVVVGGTFHVEDWSKVREVTFIEKEDVEEELRQAKRRADERAIEGAIDGPIRYRAMLSVVDHLVFSCGKVEATETISRQGDTSVTQSAASDDSCDRASSVD